MTDPRIRRTRLQLQDALRRLMAEKGFDEISVQDVTAAAGVNRATFYDHYADKFALLEAWVAAGFHRLLRERNVNYDGSCPSGAAALILATCDYLAETRSNQAECRRQGAFEPLVDAAVIAAIRRVTASGAKGKSRPAPAEMAAAAASWAIFGAAKEWLLASRRPPAEKIVPEVLRLVLPLLEAGGDGRR